METNKAKYTEEVLLSDIDIELGLLGLPETLGEGTSVWAKSNVEWIVALLKLLILIIEKIAKTPKPNYEYYPEKGLSGEVKLDALAKFLDSKIELPWPLEMFDDRIIKFLISVLVQEFNKIWGHRWLTNRDGEPLEVKCNWVKANMDIQRGIIERAVA